MDIFRRKKFDEAMFAKNRTLAIRVGQYQSSDIKEASFDYGYIKGDTYKPGGTCAGSAKIVFTSIITTFNKLDKIYPEIGLLVDGAYEWVKMGEYFINDIEIDRNRKTTKLDLMDGMFKLNREHVTDLTYPAEIRHVIKEICLKTGVKLANENMDIASMNYRIESIPKEKKMTFRDVLSLASQMLGMSCFFNREGKLEIKELTDSGITITADSYFMHGLTKSEVEYQIAGITCKKDKETLTVGMRTGRSLELDNLFMSQAILDNLYHKIKDIRYYPFNLNYQGHLLLNVGEWVTIKTNTGETFKSPVLSQSFTFKGGLRGRISADSKAGNDAQYSYAGTITKKIVQFNEFEAQIQNQIEEADKGFDQKVAKIKKDFSDQVELAKARAEEVKRELSDTIDQRFSSFNNGSLQEIKRRAEEALRNAGASSLLAQEAKRIGLDSVAKLEEFKEQATSAQTALSGDLDALKRTVTSEVNQASEYRRTTTEALSRMTGQMNGFATKSEVKQDIDGLTQTFAKMKVGGRNLWIKSKTVGAVIEKLPENHVTGQKECYRLENNSTLTFNIEPNFSSRLYQKVTYSAWIKFENVVQGQNSWNTFNCFKHYLFRKNSKTGIQNGPDYTTLGIYAGSSDWKYITFTYDYSENQNFDQLKTSLRFNLEGVTSGTAWVTGIKVEIGSVATDYSPAIEDVEAELLVAKTEFKKTAEGLSTKIAAVESYVGQDGQRQEALRRYTREESARQATAVRELVTRDYVGKSAYQEDVRGIERRLEAITNPQNGSIATQIAKYKTAVDGRFADITSMISGKANQTDFQRVRETSQLYERIIGNNENDISNKVARMALTNQLFQVEVSKYSGNGVNRALNTTSDWGPFISRSGGNGVNLHADLHKILSSGFKAGDTVHVRMEISIDDVQRFNDKQIVAILQSYGDVTNWTRTGRTFDYNIGTLQSGNNWRLIEFNTVMTEEMLRNNSWMLNLRVDGAKSYKVHTKIVKIEKGNIASAWSPAPEDTEEAVRTVQSQLAGSWGVHNKNSVNEIIAGFNLAGRNAGIKAETIRLEGRTLLDELTAIQGYFKRLFVGDANVGTLNSDIIRANSITADKLVMDMAMARRFVSSDIFTDTLAAKEAFINKLRSVVVTATLLEGYKGRIGGFQIGTHEKDSSVYWITGQNQFSVGMSNGSGHWSQTALWVNWGNKWESPSDYAWFVKHTGQMYCYNRAEFWNTPIIHGDLKVTGHIFYNNENSGKSGHWIHSSKYSNFEPSDNYLYLYYSGSGYDWIPMNKEISDRRYKHNIEASTVSGLDVVKNLKTYSYLKEYDGKTEDIACGIMAQDVQKYAPEAFFENPDGAYSYNTFALVPYLIKAIQELNQKIEKLEKTA